MWRIESKRLGGHQAMGTTIATIVISSFAFFLPARVSVLGKCCRRGGRSPGRAIVRPQAREPIQGRGADVDVANGNRNQLCSHAIA